MQMVVGVPLPALAVAAAGPRQHVTREDLIDEAVRCATHAVERRVLLIDFVRLGGWPTFNRDALERIRVEYHRLLNERVQSAAWPYNKSLFA